MRRISIAEIMRETGLSRATVDRVLNGRARVHPRTKEVVERTLKQLEVPGISGPRLGTSADILLRVGRGMLGQMRAAWDNAKPDGRFVDLYQGSEADVLAAVRELCKDTARPLIITAKNTDRLTDLLRIERKRGKRVIAVVSDLAADARDCFVGIDNRAAGQTAAFIVGRSLGERPSKVGIVVGDSVFRCHEDREIGFRTGLRSQFPAAVLSGEARGEDSSDLTREAVLTMLNQHPKLEAIYNVGGGNLGLVSALRDSGRAKQILIVCHEVNSVTAPLLRDAEVDFAIASDPSLLLTEALRIAALTGPESARETALFDFAVHTKFNLPRFGMVPIAAIAGRST